MAPRESYINLTCKSHLLPNQAGPQVLGARFLWGGIAQPSAVCFSKSPARHGQGPTGTSTRPVPGILQALNVCTTLGRYVQQGCRPGNRPRGLWPCRGSRGRGAQDDGGGRGSCKT